ncbi:TrbI/VirB10 family protein [Roseitranquillus sediminis]|uniref:TrbI/VirB10 family protein n=1 Tax=Roseitranquillus sediminis TaxID=2809051 RepID=UPI001D0C0133|nr:TrbI/VirB10 family protein [Roseitranquillus sediminis]MBM9595056.1 hypothetical protein [Roseitranquillus sediminis]
MSDQTDTGSRHIDPVSQRRARLEGRSANPVVRMLTGALLLVAFAAVAVLILAPGEVKRLFTAGASESEDMQEPSTPASDLMFEPTTEPVEVVTTDPTIVLPPAEDDADPDRIAALEREIEALRAAKGQSAEELRALLAEQAATLQEQFDRERASLEERHQRELQDALAARPVTAGIADLGESEAEAEARRRLEEERARRAEIREAQIMSDGIVLDAGGSITGEPQGAGGSGARRQLTGNEAFIASASTQSYDRVRATAIAAPDRTVVQGTVLRATLETAISTELPGVIRAVISDDVWSYDGSTVLLPRGTRLLGSYNSDVSVVQGRVQLAWSRAVTPDGVSVEIGGYGADTLGRSGQEGFVDGRFRQRFGSAALISLIGTAPEVVVPSETGATGQDVAEDLGGDLETSAQGVMGDYLSAPPVIYVEQGTAITVFVNRDLVF